MGATNHTTNYNLPQFIGSDKPTWLGDVNGAMSTIDTQMKENSDLATTAKSTADTADTKAGTAINNASDAQTTANGAQTTATSALNKALANEANLNSMFNFTKIKQVTLDDITASGCTVSSVPLSCAMNDDEYLFKIYGAIGIASHSVGPASVTIHDVFTSVATSYSIDSAGMIFLDTPASAQAIRRCTLTINLDGSVTINWVADRADGGLLLLWPCLYINQDFGDNNN